MLSSPFTYMPDPAPDNIPAASPVPDGTPAPAPPRKPTLLEALSESNAGYKKLWPFVDKYRGRFIASIIAGGGSAILTAAQVRVVQLVTKHSFGQTMDATAAKHAPVIREVLLVCSLLPLVIVARCFCDYMENYYMTWVSLRVLHDLRVKIFQHILGQSLDFFNKSKIGSLISRIANDTRSAQLAITAVTDDIVTQPLTVIFVIYEMLKIDWHFTLYSLCLFPLCLLPITIFGRKVRKIGRQDETCNAELMVLIQEALSGIRLVKSLCREPHEQKRFNDSSNHMVSVGLKVRKAMAIVGPIIESMGSLGIMAAMVYASFSHLTYDKFTALLVCPPGPLHSDQKGQQGPHQHPEGAGRHHQDF